MKKIKELLILNRDNLQTESRRNSKYRHDIEKILYHLTDNNLITGKEWGIMRLRLLEAQTLESVGKHLGVTRERIRQIEAKVYEKMKCELKEVTYIK